LHFADIFEKRTLPESIPWQKQLKLPTQTLKKSSPEANPSWLTFGQNGAVLAK
jgi:hypothetical protein